MSASPSPASATASDGVSPEDALAAAILSVRDREHFDRAVKVRCRSLTFLAKARRLAAAILPFDRHHVLRDLWRERAASPNAAALSLTQPAETHTTVLSRKYRCVWHRITKCASTSIMASLLAADPDCLTLRVPETELYARWPEARDWFTFAFLRHPFARALSFWSEIAGLDPVFRLRDRKRISKFGRCYGLAECTNFDAYVAWLQTPYGADAYVDAHVLSQSVPIGLAAKARGRPPDFIGRLESIDADWAKVVDEVGLPWRRLPLLNSVVGWEQPRYDVEAGRAIRGVLLTEPHKALLAARFADDLALGGYSPTSLDVVGPVALPFG